MAHRHHVSILHTNTSSVALLTAPEQIEFQHGVGIRLLNVLLAEYRRPVVISDEMIKKGEFGKPYLEDGPKFSIAHSGQVVVAAISNGDDIGIDIEYIRNLPWQEYAEMFSAKEWDTIKNSLSPADTMLELWVKKESVLKAAGYGLQIPFTDVDLEQDFATIRNSGKKFYLTPVPIGNCRCCLSTYEKDTEVSVRAHSLT